MISPPEPSGGPTDTLIVAQFDPFCSMTYKTVRQTVRGVNWVQAYGGEVA